MPPRRGKGPSVAILLVAFILVGYVYFQLVKERRASGSVLLEKEAQVHRYRKDFEEVNKIAGDLRQVVSRLTLENQKLIEERINLKTKLAGLEHEKTADEKEKQDLVESFQGKKDEIDGLKQKLSHLQENEAEIASLKVKVESLEKELKSARAHQPQDFQKVSDNKQDQESSETIETSKIGNEAFSTLQNDKSNRDLEEKKQSQEQGSGKREEHNENSLTEDDDNDNGDQLNENEDETGINNADNNAGDAREELAEAAEENEDREEDDKDDDGNETESVQEKEDASSTFSKEEDVSDREEAHLESLEHDVHEVDQE